MMRTKRERGLSLTTCLLLLALTIFVAPTSAQVLQYEFEEGTGLTTSDLTGNGHTGHLMGGAAFSFGKHPSSGGLLFDGSNDYVAISNLFYQGTNYATFSVSFWLKTTDKSNQVIASFDREEYWRVEINGPSAGQGDVGFTVATTSGAVESLGGTTRIDNGLWHHIVTVFDNGVLSLYIDGVLNNSKTVAGTTFGTGSTRYGFIGVGSEADVYDGSKSPTDYFNGSLDDFRIYNMGLTQTEVQALYDQKLADGLDADEDGLDDLWEYQYLLDLSQGPADDYDLDGLNNLNEFTNGTDPSYDHAQSSDPKLFSTVLSNVSDSWQSVSLPESYDSMVVVATPVYTSSEEPAVVRVRNAVGNSLEIKLQSPGDLSTVDSLSVHVMVVEEGSYVSDLHGVSFEAVKLTSSITDSKNNWVGEPYIPQDYYANPVVLGQVMSENDPLWSVFWARGKKRSNPPLADVIYVGKHVASDSIKTRANETLGVLIFEEGLWEINGVEILAGLGTDSVRDLSKLSSYPISGITGAQLAVLSSAAMDVNEGGWPVLIAPNELNTTQVTLGIDEDKIADNERNHGTEQVAYLIMESNSGNSTPPWLGASHTLPGVIEAEDYDIGANGVAYFDSTPGNNGNQYRNDDVDIEVTSDTGGGYNLAWVTAGEYLSYSVDVTQAAAYNITARVATGITSLRNFHIEIDGVNVGNMSLLRKNSKKGWQNWTDVTLENVQLTPGEKEVRFVFDNGRLNLNKLTFSVASEDTEDDGMDDDGHGDMDDDDGHGDMDDDDGHGDMDDDDGHGDMDDDDGHGGHGHFTSITSVSDNINDFATHAAMQNGDWNDPNTWMMGHIPDEGAIVHIHHGVDVTYSSNNANTHIFYIHVDGNFNVTSDSGTSRLQVDTIVTTPGSELNIDGSSGNLLDIVISPYNSNKINGLKDRKYTANGEKVNDGHGVLGRYQWDPEQMSLGIVTEGKVDIKGRKKIGHLEMSETGQDGDDFIYIDISKYNLNNTSNLADIQNEIGWSLGDIIVVGGTEYYRPDDQKTYDEQTAISSLDILDGKLVVGLEDKLKYDHKVTELDTDSDGSLETRLSPTVINLSKNVQIRSEVSTNTDGNGYVDSVEMKVITQNGHTMFMHTTDVSIQDVNFAGLGRTDKSIPIDDIDIEGHAEDPIDITNHRGRYSLHLHMNGFMESGDKNLDDDIGYGGAYLSGNLVWGSPGWGMTHHAGLATLTDNVTYDVFGAGFVSETGDEMGAWDNNVAMKMIGTSKPADERSTVGNQDFGNTGVGFWFESRMIEVTNNKSISSDSAPFFVDGSGGQSATINIEDLPDFLLPYANALDRSGGLDGMVAARDIPVFRFDNNMATATHTGIWVEEGAGMVGRDIGALEHDIRSIYTNHQSYNIERSGFFVVNTSQVTAIDTIVSGTYPEDGVGSGITGHAGQAFAGGAYQQAYEVALNGVYLDNFGAGAKSFNKVYFSTDPIQHQGSSVMDHTFVNLSISDTTIDRLDRPISHDVVLGETSDLFSTTYHGNRSTTKLRSAPDFTDNDGSNVVENRFTVILGSQSNTLAYSATRSNDLLLEKVKVTDENYIFDSDEVKTGNVDPESYVTGIWGVKIDSAGATYAPFIDHHQDGHDFDNIGKELSMVLTVSDLEYLVNKNGMVEMNGERFVVMEEYFSDRLTGMVETVHYVIRLNGGYWNQFETSVEVNSLTFGYAKDNIGNASITMNNVTYSENEKFLGTNKDDLIFAQFGDDVVNGGSGDDILYGGFGDDKLNGGKGNDILIAGGGSDVLDGGPGTDTAVMQGRIDDYIITQLNSKSYTISSSLWLDGENILKNIEYIQFNGDTLLTDPSNSLGL